MQDYVNRLLLAINRYDPNDVQTVDHLRDLVCRVFDNNSLKRIRLLRIYFILLLRKRTYLATIC